MPYPVILGGDHAAFESEWADSGRPETERPDWPLPSFDAQDWAKAFCERFKISMRHKTWREALMSEDLDAEGLMISWFANALMRGYDERGARASEEAGTEAREFIALWMMDRGYATGHGDTVADLLSELEGGARDRGR